MFRFVPSLNSFILNVNKCKYKVYAPQIRKILYSTSNSTIKVHRRAKKISPTAFLLLVVPGSTFALGTWQVQRKEWKENLIAELKSRTSSDPIQLPYSIEEVNDLEYYPVHVHGHFLHDREMYIGPRSLIQAGDAATKSSLFSKGESASSGYLVVTPFKLSDREETILINRGWVSNKHKDPRTRKTGQIQNEVDVVGIVRLQENRPQFMPSNKPESNMWFYRDVQQMSDIAGTSPIFLDATNDFDIPGGPVGGQTRISLRNEHLSYVLTWYSLCIVTSFMWYSQFIKGVKL